MGRKSVDRDRASRTKLCQGTQWRAHEACGVLKRPRPRTLESANWKRLQMFTPGRSSKTSMTLSVMRSLSNRVRPRLPISEGAEGWIPVSY